MKNKDVEKVLFVLFAIFYFIVVGAISMKIACAFNISAIPVFMMSIPGMGVAIGIGYLANRYKD